jgi:hypothetical protein
MQQVGVDLFKVYRECGWNVVYVPPERGEELRIHLESHGIRSRVGPTSGKSYERVEVEGEIDVDDLQAIIDCWER